MAKERNKNTSASASECDGGNSFNCSHTRHPKGREVFCYRCQSFMGCAHCCERESELICLNCHNWASRKALFIHGNIVPNSKQPRVRTDEGVKVWSRGEPDPVDRVRGLL